MEPGYGEIPVPPGLSGLVVRLWWLRMPSPQPFERILPIPAVHLVVNLSAPYRIVSHGRRPVDRLLEGPFLSGIQFEHLHNENPAELRHVGAELAPWALPSFGIDPSALAGQVLPAEPLLPGVAELAAELAEGEDGDAAAERLAALLLARRSGPAADPRAVRAVEALIADPGRRIAPLAAELGLSDNSFTALLRRSCGATPKRFAELARHHRFLSELPPGSAPPRWAELVARGGYYDQPHFIREFRRFAGMTPSAFLERLRAGATHPSFLPFEE